MKHKAKFKYITLLITISVCMCGFKTNHSNYECINIKKEMIFLKGGEFHFRDSVWIVEDFYVSKFELTNKQYNEFISDLRSRNDNHMLSICQRDSVLWEKVKSPFTIIYHTHPDYQNHPVVTVSYEAATLYCQWLTDKYNSSTDRKFNKLVFFLPSEVEWLIAANYQFKKPGVQYDYLMDENNLFTWENKQIYSENAELKAKLKIPTEYRIGRQDELLKPVNHYEENKNNCFCIHGNVAEMTNEKGKAKGGSWNSLPSESFLCMNQYYSDKSIEVGFRVFMRVIEE